VSDALTMLRRLVTAGVLVWYLLSRRQRRVADEATFGKIVMPSKEVRSQGAVPKCRHAEHRRYS